MISRDEAARRLGAELNGDDVGFDSRSLLQAVGGWLGIAETSLPTLAFLITFTIFENPLVSVSSASALAVAFIAWRAIRRESLTQAIVGLLAVGLAAWLALRAGGSTADYFIPGFFTNAAYGTVLAISALIRWPLIGVLAGLLFQITGWRENRRLRRVFSWVTWLWVGFFSARLIVQLPLYFAGEITALATARLIMGAPAYALLLVLTWVLLRAAVNAHRPTKLETEQQEN